MQQLTWLFWALIRGWILIFSGIGIVALIEHIGGVDIPILVTVLIVVAVSILDGVSRAMIERKGLTNE